MLSTILILTAYFFLAYLSSVMLMLFLCDEYFVNNIDESYIEIIN